ncbi:hypothetical protein ACFLRO_00580 [Bacteroidota bacterium]
MRIKKHSLRTVTGAMSILTYAIALPGILLLVGAFMGRSIEGSTRLILIGSGLVLLIAPLFLALMTSVATAIGNIEVYLERLVAINANMSRELTDDTHFD